jgi:hypothetical protein
MSKMEWTAAMGSSAAYERTCPDLPAGEDASGPAAPPSDTAELSTGGPLIAEGRRTTTMQGPLRK